MQLQKRSREASRFSVFQLEWPLFFYNENRTGEACEPQDRLAEGGAFRLAAAECERFRPMTLKIVLEPGEDGWIVAECPALPGCIRQGRTEAEAIDNIREAMELWLETELEKRTGSLSKDAKILEVTV